MSQGVGPVETELSPSQSKADSLRASELPVVGGVLVLKMGKLCSDYLWAY